MLLRSMPCRPPACDVTQADLAYGVHGGIAGLVDLADVLELDHHRPRALRTNRMSTQALYGTFFSSSLENWRPSPMMAVMRA